MSENNEVSGYIYDGYTQEAFIAGKERKYPAVTFTYRPVLTQNRSVVAFEITKSDPRKQEEIAAELIERQVVSWDLKSKLHADDMEPQAVPIKAVHILRLHPILCGRLYFIVLGDDAGDVKATESVNTEDGTKGDLERALSGAGPEDTEGKQAKN